jgi:hypothetical protein
VQDPERRVIGNDLICGWLCVKSPDATHWLQERQNRPIGLDELI